MEGGRLCKLRKRVSEKKKYGDARAAFFDYQNSNLALLNHNKRRILFVRILFSSFDKKNGSARLTFHLSYVEIDDDARARFFFCICLSNRLAYMKFEARW